MYRPRGQAGSSHHRAQLLCEGGLMALHGTMLLGWLMLRAQPATAPPPAGHLTMIGWEESHVTWATPIKMLLWNFSN